MVQGDVGLSKGMNHRGAHLVGSISVKEGLVMLSYMGSWEGVSTPSSSTYHDYAIFMLAIPLLLYPP
jgi:hypothetical protein